MTAQGLDDVQGLSGEHCDSQEVKVADSWGLRCFQGVKAANGRGLRCFQSGRKAADSRGLRCFQSGSKAAKTH